MLRLGVRLQWQRIVPSTLYVCNSPHPSNHGTCRSTVGVPHPTLQNDHILDFIHLVSDTITTLNSALPNDDCSEIHSSITFSESQALVRVATSIVVILGWVITRLLCFASIWRCISSCWLFFVKVTGKHIHFTTMQFLLWSRNLFSGRISSFKCMQFWPLRHGAESLQCYVLECGLSAEPCPQLKQGEVEWRARVFSI